MSAIPKTLSYGAKPVSVPCKRRTVVIPCSNKTNLTEGEVSEFYLPALGNAVLDHTSAFLRFSVTIATANGYVDNSASSFIDKIVTSHGANTLSQINNYGILACMLNDLQLSQSDKHGLSPAMGFEEAGYAKIAGNVNVTGDNLDTYLPTVNRMGQAVASGSTYTFCIPLLNPVVGTLAQKMCPLFALSDSIRLSITWATSKLALVGTSTHTIKNPEIIYDVLELEQPVIDIVKQTYGGRELTIPSYDWALYSTQIEDNLSANFSKVASLTYRSALMLLMAFRPSSTQTQAGYATSSRVNPMWQANDYLHFRTPHGNIPTNSIKTSVNSEFSSWFTETQRALQSWNSLQMNGSIPKSYYTKSPSNGGYTIDATSYKNAFVLGLSLDTMRNQSECVSGLDLSAGPCYLEGYLSSIPTVYNGTGGSSVTADIFCLFNLNLVVDPTTGIMTRVA